MVLIVDGVVYNGNRLRVVFHGEVGCIATPVGTAHPGGTMPHWYQVGPDRTEPVVSSYRDYFCTNYYYGYYEDTLAYLRGSCSGQDISIAIIRGAEWGQGDERKGYQYPTTNSGSYLVVTGDIIPVTYTQYTWEWWNY